MSDALENSGVPAPLSPPGETNLAAAGMVGEPLPASPPELIVPATTPPPSQLMQTLWISGALLWAYVVSGEYVIRADLPEVLGVLGVLGALAASWHKATSSLPADPLWPRALPGLLALGLGAAVVIFGLIVADALHFGHSELFGLVLLALGVLSYFAGRRLTKLPAALPASRGRRAISVVLWMIASVATLIALVNIGERV